MTRILPAGQPASVGHRSTTRLRIRGVITNRITQNLKRHSLVNNDQNYLIFFIITA